MSDRKLRDQLVGLESFSPALQERYRKGVKAMLEKRLSGAQRLAWSISSSLSVAIAVFFAIVAYKLPSRVPVIVRGTFIMGIFFSAAWAVLGFTIVRRGVINRRKHINAGHALTFLFTLALMIIFLFIGQKMPDGIKGIQLILFGMVFLLSSGVPSLMLKHMNDAELRLREQMLNLELRIAELAEKQGADAPAKKEAGPSDKPGITPRS